MNKTTPIYAARLKERQTPVTFREIANECDGFDKAVDEVNESRKAFWGEVRKVVKPGDIKPLKAAIKARRKRKADLDGEEAYETRVAEILEEIETGPDLAKENRTRARAPREDITAEAVATLQAKADVILQAHDDWVTLPPHDPDGVLIEEPAAPPESFQWAKSIRDEGWPEHNEAAPASGDAVETRAVSEHGHKAGTSPTIPPADRDLTSPCLQAAIDNSHMAVAAPFPDLPDFLSRKKQMEEAA